MKKNFFKKLSFVLALAMIVSVLAPAAGAFAAAKAPKLNATKKYLHLSRDNEYDFNISNKQKGWKYDWSSANENVAEVNGKNGVVTATGAGTTKVSVVIYDKDGEEYATLKATVVVRDNIKTVKISNAPENNTLKVNESFDFNRSYTTEANKTKGSESVTRWSVDKAGATINDKGEFVATEAGKYVVTARSFQSGAKYDAWKALKDEAATLNVLATDTVEVTVAASIVATKQINTSKFSVEFDADMSKSDLSATTAKLFQVINGTKLSTGTEKIKEVKIEGKVATVEIYSNFNPKTTYEFVYGDLVGTFTAASAELKDVAGIIFDDLTADIDNGTAKAAKLLEKVTGINKDGVVIFKGDTSTDFANALTFTYEGDLSKGYVNSSDKTVFIYTKGYSAPVKAKFSTYVYNETTKVYDNVTFEDSALVTGQDVDKNVNTATLEYFISKDDGDSGKTWKTSGFSIAAKDTGYHISTRYKTFNDKDNWVYDASGTNKFTYTSSNTDKLIINGDYLYPIADGVVTVLVKNDDTNKTVVGSFDITIQAARGFASAAIDNPYVTVGNHASYGALNEKVATITVKDTMGDALTVAKEEIKTLSTPAAKDGIAPTAPSIDVEIVASTDKDNYGKVYVKATAQGATEGVYYYEIKLKAHDTTKSVFVTVSVADATTTDNKKVANWRVEVESNNVDLKKAKEAKNLWIKVNGYNSKGVKVDQLGVADYALTIKKGGSDINTASATWYTKSSVDVITVSGGVLKMLEANTYVIEVKAVGASNPTGRAADAMIGSVSFTVADTTTKSFVVEDPTVNVASGSVLTMVQKAFSFYLNGDKVSDADENNIVEIVYNDGSGSDKTWPADTTTFAQADKKSIFVKSVKYQVINSDKGTRTEYKYDVNTTIRNE